MWPYINEELFLYLNIIYVISISPSSRIFQDWQFICRCVCWLKIKVNTCSCGFNICSFLYYLWFPATLLALEKAFMLGIWHSRRQLKLQILTSFSHFPHFCNSSQTELAGTLLYCCYCCRCLRCFVAHFLLVSVATTCWCCSLPFPVDVAVSLSNCHFPLYNNCYV